MLRGLGVGISKGDRVAIYMPMVPEAVLAMLACARIGAIHSVVFGGFSAESLRDRINDSQCKLLITADGCHRRGIALPLKKTADDAVEGCPSDPRTCWSSSAATSRCTSTKDATTGTTA